MQVNVLTESLFKRIIDALEADLADYTHLIRLTERIRDQDKGTVLLSANERQDTQDTEPISLTESSEHQNAGTVPLSILIRERAATFATLQNRAEEVRGWGAEFCRGLGIKAFTLKDLDGRIPAQAYARLSQCLSGLQERMAMLQQLSADLKAMFEQELEGTKLELHRLQGRKRLRQAYYGQGQEAPEARFIDKEK